MHGWFDEDGPDEPAARHAVGDHSPKCADGRHFQCAGWWWVTKDKIAITCQCSCHQVATTNSSGGPPRRASG